MLRLEDGRNYKADSSMTSRYVPVAGDYVVEQEDLYVYLNPAPVFERKYRALPADGAASAPAPADEWKPTAGRMVTVRGYIANGTDEHPGIITRVHGAGEGALVNVTAFPDLQSPKIFSSIPVYTSRAAARDAIVGPSRANGYAFFPDRV